MLWNIVVAIAAVQVLVPLLLLVLRNRVLFYPASWPTAADALTQLAGTDARLIEVTRPDGRVLTGYDARPAGGADVPVILFFHGNAGNVGNRAGLLRWIVEGTGLRVVLASYSGYGGNAGSPSEGELEVDALAFHDYLTGAGVDPARIVIYGESIGGAPALFVASERGCAGVIVQSTIASVSSMALHLYPWLPLAALLARGQFPSAERAAELSVPLLIVHGTRDRIVPYAEGEALREAAPAAEFLSIEDAGHNDLFEIAGTEYLDDIARRVRDWTAD